MEFKQIKELIRLVNQTEISELKIEMENFKISLRSKEYTEAINKSKAGSIMMPTASPIVAPPAVVPVSPPTTAQAPKQESGKTETNTETANTTNLHTIKSPMIGTFYRSSGPDKPPYIKIGDMIAKGDTLCIVEAMKLFNEIEAEVNGKIVEILVDDASPVEYDQPLFRVELA